MEVKLEETSLSEDMSENMENTEGHAHIDEEANVGQGEQKSEQEDRSSFVHGLSVGLGIGCIATFVIMWITVFFSPMLPSTITYESLLSVFIYPLIYLLAVGLVALTAGIVREYYVRKQ